MVFISPLEMIGTTKNNKKKFMAINEVSVLDRAQAAFI